MRFPGLGVALAAVVVLALPVHGAGGPENLTRRRQQLEQVRDELAQQRGRLRSVRQQERRALVSLGEMDQRREQAEGRLRSLQHELSRSQVKARATAGNLKVVQRRLADQRMRIDGRLRDMYKWGRRGYVEVLLDVEDFSDFVTRAHFLTAIMQADARLLEDYGADARRYVDLHQELLEEQDRISTLIGQTARQRAEIVVETTSKQELLGRIQHERALYEQVIKDLERTDRELITLIRRMQAAGGPRLVRFQNFIWPARGPFTSGFGMRRHPIFRVRRMHSGIDIAAPWGSPVQAASDGVVIYTGWFGGYGKIVVLDHGGGISTLYAHLSSFVARPGQVVRKGDPIARVGSTGYSTGPHVHFEVRINGRPVNPAVR